MHILNKSFIISILFCATSSVGATEPFFCSDDAAKCLHLTKSECVRAAEMSGKSCMQHYGLKLDDIYNSDAYKKVGDCAMKQFFKVASISEAEWDSCQTQLRSAYSSEVERINKQDKSSGRWFDAPGDPISAFEK